MSIFDRIQRIAKANVNWLLDKVEPSEQELESKIKELAETIQQGRESAASYGATFKRLQRELEGLKQRQTELVTEAEQAIKGGNEDMAHRLVTEKVKLGERISQIAPGVEQGRQTFELLKDNIIKLQDQLQAARVKLSDLKARKRAAEAQKAFDEQLSRSTATSTAGVAFDRLEDEVLQAEAEIEIHQEIRGEALSDVELAQQSRDLQIEAELQAIKNRMAENE